MFREEGKIGSKSREEGEVDSESREKGDLPPCSTPLQVKNRKHWRKLATKQCCVTSWGFFYLVFRRLYCDLLQNFLFIYCRQAVSRCETINGTVGHLSMQKPRSSPIYWVSWELVIAQNVPVWKLQFDSLLESNGRREFLVRWKAVWFSENFLRKFSCHLLLLNCTSLHFSPFLSRCIFVPRSRTPPFGQHQKLRALGQLNTGGLRYTDFKSNLIGCSLRSSRFLSFYRPRDRTSEQESERRSSPKDSNKLERSGGGERKGGGFTPPPAPDF